MAHLAAFASRHGWHCGPAALARQDSTQTLKSYHQRGVIRLGQHNNMAAYKHLILTSPPDDSTIAAWNDCLDNSEFAGLYVTSDFLRVLYFKDQRPFAVLAVSDGVVHGVVTGVVGDRDIECGHSGSPQICLRRGSSPEAVGEVLAEGLRRQVLP